MQKIGPKNRNELIGLLLTPNQDPTMSKKTSEPPQTLEVGQRQIIVVANQTILDVKTLRNRYRIDTVNFPKCRSAAIDLAKLMNVPTADIDDARNFTDMLREGYSNKKLEHVLRRRIEYDRLDTVCNRAMNFEKLTRNAQTRLQIYAEKHLFKYCVSLSQEPEAEFLRSAHDYEARIQHYKSEIVEKMYKLEDLMNEYKNLRSPFINNFLQHHKDVNKVMEVALTTIIDLSIYMKQWAQDDKNYPKKLWDEVITSNITRGKLLEQRKKLERRIHEIEHILKRRKNRRERTAAKLADLKDSHNKGQGNKTEIETDISDLNKDIEEKKKELKDKEDKFTKRKSKSTKYSETLTSTIERLKSELAELEKLKRDYNRKMKDLKRNSLGATGTISSLEKDMRIHDEFIGNMETKMADVRKNLEMNAAEYAKLDYKATAAKKLRELKLSPNLLSKSKESRAGSGDSGAVSEFDDDVFSDAELEAII